MEISDIHDLNLASSVFDFGDVKLVGRVSVCKPFSSPFGDHQPMHPPLRSIVYQHFFASTCITAKSLFLKKTREEKNFLEKVNIANIILQLNLGY